MKEKPDYIAGLLAEREGFEPPDLLQSTVFKTAAIDHSAISPFSPIEGFLTDANIQLFFIFPNFLNRNFLCSR